jgi:hypothetical protein
MGTPTKTKGAVAPLACSVHDPVGSSVVVNTKQPFITLTLTGVLISNPACCNEAQMGTPTVLAQ